MLRHLGNHPAAFCEPAFLNTSAWNRVPVPCFYCDQLVCLSRSGPCATCAAGATVFSAGAMLDIAAPLCRTSPSASGWTAAIPSPTGTATPSTSVPDSFRYLGDFLPALRNERKSLRFRVGRRFVEEWRTPRRWSLDRPSPFERVRILDPEPVRDYSTGALERMAAAFPAFAAARVAQHWAGLIDVTPDAVPVISAVDALPGFHVATGFSGHGFGIGPGAGRLMADLVTGRSPIVDPTPFRFSRFSDGSRPQPIVGL